MKKIKIKDPTKHPFETIPPHQEKYLHAGDDNWELHGTACPIDTPKVNSNRGNANVAATAGNTEFMRPMYTDTSYAFHGNEAGAGHKRED